MVYGAKEEYYCVREYEPTSLPRQAPVVLLVHPLAEAVVLGAGEHAIHIRVGPVVAGVGRHFQHVLSTAKWVQLEWVGVYTKIGVQKVKNCCCQNDVRS